MSNDRFVHAYIRVSDLKSKKSGISPESQVALANEYKSCLLNSHQWCNRKYPDDANDGFYMDLATSAWRGKKGYLRNRPAGRVMLSALRAGDHVLFASVDRGFRNVGDFGMFLNDALENSWNVHFIRESIDLSTPSGRMRAHILAAMAEYYSSILSCRIREALAHRGMDVKDEKKKKVVKPKIDAVDSQFFPHRVPRVDAEVKTGKVYLYIRASDHKQVDSHLGLDAQEAIVTKYARWLGEKHPGLEVVVEVFADKGVSAFKTPFVQRRAAAGLMSKLQAGDHIVVLRFDRIFRSVRDMDRTVEMFDNKGVTLHLCEESIRTDDRHSRIYMNFLVAVAQMESEMRAIRQLEVNQVMREHGRPVTRLKIGHKLVRKNGKVRMMIDFDAMTDMYTGLALIDRGMPTAKAAAWVRAIRRDRGEKKLDLVDDSQTRTLWTKYLVDFRESVHPHVVDVVKRSGLNQLLHEPSEESLKKCGYYSSAVVRKPASSYPMPF